MASPGFFPPSSSSSSGDNAQSGAHLRVWVGTWNAGATDLHAEAPPEQLAEWPGLLEAIPPGFDVYVMALQEGSTDGLFNGLTAYLSRHCGADRVELHEDRIWGRGDGALLWPKFTGIAVWIARSSRPRCEVVRSCPVSCGFFRGSKGGVALALCLDGAKLCFLGCHLSAETPEHRAKDCALLLEECAFQLCPGCTLQEHFDSIVFFGDLNYRLAEKGQEGSLTVVRCEEMLAQGSARELWNIDPVAGELSRGDHPLEGFLEPLPSANFYPTYKKRPKRAAVPVRQDLDWVQAEFNTRFVEPWYKGGRTRLRMPSFTDRILVYSRQDATLALCPCGAGDCNGTAAPAHRYDSLSCISVVEKDAGQEARDFFGGSDHSPVAAEFELKTPVVTSPTPKCHARSELAQERTSCSIG